MSMDPKGKASRLLINAGDVNVRAAVAQVRLMNLSGLYALPNVLRSRPSKHTDTALCSRTNTGKNRRLMEIICFSSSSQLSLANYLHPRYVSTGSVYSNSCDGLTNPLATFVFHNEFMNKHSTQNHCKSHDFGEENWLLHLS